MSATIVPFAVITGGKRAKAKAAKPARRRRIGPRLSADQKLQRLREIYPGAAVVIEQLIHDMYRDAREPQLDEGA